MGSPRPYKPMSLDAQTLAAFVTGAVIPLLIALLGRESVGRWLLAGQVRETTALNALIALLDKSVDGWQKATTELARLRETVHGNSRDEGYHYQDLRSRLDAEREALEEIKSKLSALVNILAVRGAAEIQTDEDA